MRPILVKTYKDAKAFERDALRQGARGYQIIEVNGQQQRVAIGCTALNALLTGPVGLAIGGRAHKGARVMVTYQYVDKEYARARKLGYYLRIAPKLILIAAVAVAIIVVVLR